MFRMMKRCDILLKLSGVTTPNQSQYVRTLFFWGGSYPLTQKDKDIELAKARAPIKIENPPSSNDLVATKPGIFIPGIYGSAVFYKHWRLRNFMYKNFFREINLYSKVFLVKCWFDGIFAKKIVCPHCVTENLYINVYQKWGQFNCKDSVNKWISVQFSDRITAEETAISDGTSLKRYNLADHFSTVRYPYFARLNDPIFYQW